MLVFALAVLVGVSLGLLGGGGSILTTPILLYAARMPGKEAIASSLAVVGVTAAFSAIQHWRAGQVRVRTGLHFAAVAMIGAFTGGRFAGLLPTNLLLGGFVLMMVGAGLRMLRGQKVESRPHEERRGKLALTGAGVGFITGLVGAGGGFIIVPALALVGGLPMRAAIGTSLMVIALQSGAGFLGHLGHVEINWSLMALVSSGALFGSLVGAMLAHRTSVAALQRSFAFFVLAMALYMGFRLLPSPMTAATWSFAVLSVLFMALMVGVQLSRGRAALRTSTHGSSAS